jgi:putative tryptophan/tyrosine transport system substrate-binding protein
VKARRSLVLALVVSAVALIVPAAETADKIARIGVLANTPSVAIGGVPADPAAQRLGEAVLGRLRELGWVEGRNLTLEYRFALGRPERLPALAAELVNLNVDVIIVNVNRAAMAVQRLTTKIPIVMLIAEDPVGAGLVQSLAHPGGNITGLVGVIDSEIVGKNLEFLEMILPRGASVAVLHNATSPTSRHYLKGWDEAVRNLSVKLVPASAATVDELEHAFVLMKQAHARGVVIAGDPLFYANRRRVNELAARHGLAASWLYREGPDAGGLMSYGASLPALARRAANYVDKILRGAKPGDLAMEQPTTFELVINLKTAAVLGLTVPEPLLRLADEVIR